MSKKTATGYTTVQTDETLRETISHGTSDYSFKFYDETMDMFDFRCIDWHWHSELEIVLVEKGNVDCFIGTEHVVLNAGSVLFINSKIIHKFTSEETAVIPNLLFLPAFISPEDSLIYKKYILPVLQNARTYQIFNPGENSKLIQLVKEIINIQKHGELVELQTHSKMTELWTFIYQNTDFSLQKKFSTAQIRLQAQLQIMMQFIQQNYNKQISLEDIAASVNVSKSTALNIFKQFINDTPVNYLLSYRLKKAADMLKATENKIDYIALETGFEYESYFNRRFKQCYGITPGQYRKLKLEN